MTTYQQKRRHTFVSSTEAGKDGDFVRLRKAGERRLERQKEQKPTPAVSEKAARVGKKKIEDDGTAKDSSRKSLFEAITSNDVSKFLSAKGSFGCKELHSIRHPDTDQNILHYALIYQRYEVAKVIIQEAGEDLLLSHHNVQHSGLTGQRNAIHILIQNNAVDKMVTMILRQIPSTDKKLNLLRMETALMIQGQRPRLLSCLHLAAYFGRTSLVSRFIEVGMNVIT